MNVGDVVYVAGTLRAVSFGVIVQEVEITRGVRASDEAHAAWIRPRGAEYFGGRVLKKFSLPGGWNEESSTKTYAFKVSNTFLTKEETLPIIEKSIDLFKKRATASVEICRQELHRIQSNLERSLQEADLYSKLDAKELLKYQTYVSPFTGKVL